jgi:hypothetical protein
VASDVAAEASPEAGDQAPVLRAATGAQGVQSLLAGAAVSKLRQRDQPLFARSVASMAVHHDAPVVQIPGDVLQTYLFRIDPAGPDLLRQMPTTQAQLPGAIASGKPVAIPLPEFMQALAGSQTAPLLALHAKPNAEAPSLAELARQTMPQAAPGQGSSADASTPASDPHAGNPSAAAQTVPTAASDAQSETRQGSELPAADSEPTSLLGGARRPSGTDLHTLSGAPSKTPTIALARSSGTAGNDAKVQTIGGRAPINSKYAGQVHPSGVAFTARGFPDFAPHAMAEVKIMNLTGNYAKDSALANQALGLPSTPLGYVWHHVEDGLTMQLIHQDLHSAVRHTGGAAVIRNGGFDR